MTDLKPELKQACPLDGTVEQLFCSIHEHAQKNALYDCPFKQECQQMKDDNERRTDA